MEKNTIAKLQKRDGEEKKRETPRNNFYGFCASSPWCDEDCCRCQKWEDATEEEREGKN